MLGTAVSYRVQKEEEESKCIASLRQRDILLTTAVWYSSSSPVSALRHCSDFAIQRRIGLCTEICPQAVTPGYLESIHLTLCLASLVIGAEHSNPLMRVQQGTIIKLWLWFALIVYQLTLWKQMDRDGNCKCFQGKGVGRRVKVQDLHARRVEQRILSANQMVWVARNTSREKRKIWLETVKTEKTQRGKQRTWNNKNDEINPNLGDR